MDIGERFNNYIKNRLESGEVWKLYLISAAMERGSEGINAMQVAERLLEVGVAPQQNLDEFVKRCGSCLGGLVAHIGILRRRSTVPRNTYYPNPVHTKLIGDGLERAGINLIEIGKKTVVVGYGRTSE